MSPSHLSARDRAPSPAARHTNPRPDPRATGAPGPNEPPEIDPPEIDPLELYAGGIDTSDYVARVLPLIRAAVPRVGDLLDVGAGGGQLGARLRDPAAIWTALEPSPAMRRRLLAHDRPPRVHASGWGEADLPAACADTVLAANMPAPLTAPAAFLARCRAWARRTVVWLVPAQRGPRGVCLGGCLPRAWHGEDETPGVDIALRGLPRGLEPAIVARTDWTFSAVVPDVARTGRTLADRLGWRPDDPRRPDLLAHLAAQAVPVPGGHRLSVPRASAVLVWRIGGLPLALGLLAAALAGPGHAQERQDVTLDQLVVTATGIPEPRSQIAGTVQVIDRSKIETSTAKSITDLLSENAVGFFSEWTPGQTSINIRGGATDGQGRDFKSQVLVLINGRRAGTANLSKLSIADVERIEIVRGPSSVIYGSQNIGGVINVILKTGQTAPGTLLEGIGGVWGLAQGRAQTGGTAGALDYYLGLSGAKRDDYWAGSGGGRMANTQWNREGVTAGMGLQIDPNNRIDTQIRTDGILGAGFRGSGANYYSKDDRTNGSFDASYSGRTEDGRFSLFDQFYRVNDEDRFKWASPIQRSSAGLPQLGTAADFNTRYLDITGNRFQPRARLLPGNELLLGWDWEVSRLRSDRFRRGVTGNNLAQVSPMDNNQTDTVHGLYAEDSQKLFDDRVVLRGGVRQTYGTTSFDPTPYLSGQVSRTRPYEATTYSVGATYSPTDWSAFRVGASSGFRAPTASEIAADFNTLGGGRIFGNPDIRPETSQQVEVGATFTDGFARLDLALFQNVIANRIITRVRPNDSTTSDYVNNPGDVVIRGVEAQFDLDMLQAFNWGDDYWRWRAYANGNYNFDMTDKGSYSVATANTHRVERVYQYQLALGTRFGQVGVPYPWTIQIQGVVNGPVWYNTEENLLIPLAEPYREFIHKKPTYGLVNVRGEVDVAPGVKLFAQVRNLFDLNYHPLFIALAGQPILADTRFYNGGTGTSAPGRDIQVGLQARF